MNQFRQFTLVIFLLNELLESPVERRADVGNALPKLNSGNSSLGDALGGELELL
jgi:hypothetical protein